MHTLKLSVCVCVCVCVCVGACEWVWVSVQYAPFQLAAFYTSSRLDQSTRACIQYIVCIILYACAWVIDCGAWACNLVGRAKLARLELVLGQHVCIVLAMLRHLVADSWTPPACCCHNRRVLVHGETFPSDGSIRPRPPGHEYQHGCTMYVRTHYNVWRTCVQVSLRRYNIIDAIVYGWINAHNRSV